MPIWRKRVDGKMGFCPYYSSNCPHNFECELWDASREICGIKRQTVVLESINTGGEDSLGSVPPSGKCKVTNIYVDPLTEKLTIEYDNTPI